MRGPCMVYADSWSTLFLPFFSFNQEPGFWLPTVDGATFSTVSLFSVPRGRWSFFLGHARFKNRILSTRYIIAVF